MPPGAVVVFVTPLTNKCPAASSHLDNIYLFDDIEFPLSGVHIAEIVISPRPDRLHLKPLASSADFFSDFALFCNRVPIPTNTHNSYDHHDDADNWLQPSSFKLLV